MLHNTVPFANKLICKMEFPPLLHTRAEVRNLLKMNGNICVSLKSSLTAHISLTKTSKRWFIESVGFYKCITFHIHFNMSTVAVKVEINSFIVKMFYKLKNQFTSATVDKECNKIPCEQKGDALHASAGVSH